MEVDENPSAPGASASASGTAAAAPGPVTAPATVQGSVTIAMHPLVVMNISEQWTRVKAQSGSPQQVIGALIGKQKGRNLEVMNSFELRSDTVDGFTIVDKDFLRLREGQYKEVFADLEFLGWYNTGEAPTDADIAVHRQICDINESPIFVKLNTHAKHQDKLPINVYETVIDLVDGEARMLFIQLPYSLATEEAERIGIDHIARLSRVDLGENSAVSENLTGQSGAIKMLHSRIKLVLSYLNAVIAGELPRNEEILRDVSSLCSRLPLTASPAFQQEFMDQCNDVALITYLGVLTKACSGLNQLINKYNLVYEKSAASVGPRGKQRIFY